MASEVAQSVGPEFKPQYHKKSKRLWNKPEDTKKNGEIICVMDIVKDVIFPIWLVRSQ
jgi:hypothetical protein